MTTTLTAATDGACSGNPGPGGWGYVLVDANGDDVRVDSGGEPDTTNQRMELQAAIAALEGAPRDAPLVILSDSRYVVQDATAWIHNWRRRGLAYRRRQGGSQTANSGKGSARHKPYARPARASNGSKATPDTR